MSFFSSEMEGKNERRLLSGGLWPLSLHIKSSTPLLRSASVLCASLKKGPYPSLFIPSFKKKKMLLFSFGAGSVGTRFPFCDLILYIGYSI